MKEQPYFASLELKENPIQQKPRNPDAAAKSQTEQILDLSAVNRPENKGWDSRIEYFCGFNRPSKHAKAIEYDAAMKVLLLDCGSGKGVKVGMVFSAFQGGNKKLGRCVIESVTDSQSKAKLLESPVAFKFRDDRVTFDIPYQSTLPRLVLHFDEEVWSAPDTLRSLLNSLQEIVGDRILIQVADQPRNSCGAALPMDSEISPKADFATILEIDQFLKNHIYVKFLTLQLSYAFYRDVQPTADSLSIGSHQLEPQHSLSAKAVKVQLERLAKLRTKADETENASIANANEVRLAITSTPPKDRSAIDKLKSELRSAVDEAFKSRHDLQVMEVTYLTMKAQAMNRVLLERTKSHAEIVDRRVDNLLNPNYRWDTIAKPNALIPLPVSSDRTKSGTNSSALASVSGVVTFRGKPFLGTLWFTSDAVLPVSSLIDDNGKFHIDGLIAGKHKITIIPKTEALEKALFGKLKTHEQPPIEMEFKPGENEFNIELTQHAATR